MPTYNFLNNDTGEYFELFLRMSEREEYLEKNPHITQTPSMPAIVSGVGASGPKIDNGFKDVLNKIKGDYRGSTIKT